MHSGHSTGSGSGPPPQRDDETPVDVRAGTSQPPRQSQRPRFSQLSQAPPPPPTGGWWRIAIAIAWIGGQLALVITADRRPEHAFGFRMFRESSTMKMALYREIIGPDGQRTRVHVENGVWGARDSGGLKRRFAWTDRVRRPELAIFDVEVSTHYGVDAQLTRLQAALDDVSSHATDDADTRRLILEVTLRRNAHEPYVVQLATTERPGGS